MLNFYETVRLNPTIDKLEIGDFLFARYTCGLGDEKVGIWAHTDYLVHVMTGRKTWRTSDGVWEADPGETLFFKKGAAIIDQHFETDFCFMLFFVPDSLVRSTVREISASLPAAPPVSSPHLALRVQSDVALSAFFQSMRTYFSGNEKPSEPLLRVKLKELIVSVLTSGGNPALAAHFRTMGDCDAPPVAEIMEANFRFNLSLEDYARMCHRSLSSFKRDFQKQFRQPPGQWLLHKRLEYSASLLGTSKASVTEIALESGFEDVSHFSRVFKNQFHVSPVAFRQAAHPGA